MNAAVAGFLGTVVGAVSSFAGVAVSNWFLLLKERESRRHGQLADFEKWRREQLHTTLLNAANLIDLYVIRWLPHKKDLERAQQDSELVKLSAEVKRCLLALLMHFPQKALPEYQKLSEHTSRTNHTAIILEDEAWEIRQILISLALKSGVSNQQPEP